MKYVESYWDDMARVAEKIPSVEKLYKKTLFITGGTGMIGSSVVDLLFYFNRWKEAGIHIVLAGRNRKRTADRFVPFEEGRDYQFVEYDATKDEAPDIEADYIIHGASNANPAIYTQQPVETMLANFIGLHALLRLAVRRKISRVLYISSSEVYGNKESQDAYMESDYGYLDILNQRASYPSAKRAAETLCVAYGEEYDLDTVIVRPGHIYGPTITKNDSRASAQFTRSAARSEDIVMKSSGMQLRSYCYTADCASAVLTVLLNGESRNAYNISNPESIVTISEIASAMAEAVGRKVIYEVPTVQEQKGYNLMINSSLDSAKLEALGWSACFNLREGAQRTISIYQEILKGEARGD